MLDPAMIIARAWPAVLVTGPPAWVSRIEPEAHALGAWWLVSFGRTKPHRVPLVASPAAPDLAVVDNGLLRQEPLAAILARDAPIVGRNNGGGLRSARG